MANENKELAEQPKTLKFQAPKEVELLNASLGGVPGVDYSRMAKEIKTPEQVAAAEGQLYQQMEPQRQRISEMESEKARVDAANKALYAESEAEKVYATENQRKRIYDENPYPKLNPTKENVQSLATLFSLIGVVGVGLGGTGKMSAMNSLGAMTGLMKGWQQGRSELFKKDLQEFEKNMTSIKSILDAADKEADRIYKLIPVDRARAETEMAALTASLGGQILKQKTQLQGIEQGISFIKDLKKTSDDAWERAFKEKKETRETEQAKETARLREKEIDVNEKLRRAQMQLTAETKAGRITQQQMMSQRAVNSLGGLVSAVEAIKELPAGTTTGLLPNLQTKDGLLNYVRNNIGRKITKREQEEMNTLFTGIGRNLASIEASGAATGLSELSKQMQSGLYINAGTDDPYKVAIKLADIKRIAVENILPAIQSGVLTKGQSAVAQALVDKLEAAIPYSTVDVIKAGRPAGKQTIGEASSQAVSGKKYATESEAQAASDRGELKAGEKVNIGGVSGTWR